MVISHCGAGILLESLRALGTPQIFAVINTSLMDNHQMELADQLANDGLVHSATPDTILSVLIEKQGNKLTKYAPKT